MLGQSRGHEAHLVADCNAGHSGLAGVGWPRRVVPRESRGLAAPSPGGGGLSGALWAGFTPSAVTTPWEEGCSWEEGCCPEPTPSSSAPRRLSIIYHRFPIFHLPPDPWAIFQKASGSIQEILGFQTSCPYNREGRGGFVWHSRPTLHPLQS